jgi:nucleoside-diphosphate kinase
MYKSLLSCILLGMTQMAFSSEAVESTPVANTANAVRVEQTLSIVKPDAVSAHHIGEIISRFEKSGLHVAGIKMLHLTKQQAQDFYAVHKERPFYAGLVDFMTSGPVVIVVLEGPNAVAKNRLIMGATDPKNADAGTLRADFAESVQRNAVHGSDSVENAKNEIEFFFTTKEIF